MNKKNICEFYEIIARNPVYKKVLQDKIKLITDTDEFKNFLEKEVIPIADKEGFCFTADDLMNYEKSFIKTKNHLSDDELDDVSGGISLRTVLSFGLSSLFIGQTILNTAVPVSATLSSKIVSKSYEHLSTIQNELIAPEETSDSEEGEDTPEIKNKQLTKQKVEQAIQELKNTDSENIDWDYMKNLDLESGATLLKTDVIKNFRLYNGYITKITQNQNGERLYSQDEGKGSANIMTCLFPSSSGELNASGGSRGKHFSCTCKPSAKSIAKLIGVIYYMRDNLNVLDETSLDGILKIDNNKIKNQVKSQIGISLSPDKDPISELTNYLNSNDSLSDAKKDNCKKLILRLKIKELSDTLNSGSNKLVNSLVKDMFFMITQQENDVCIPKYTLEKIILAYFVNYFNSEDDVKDFYSELSNQVITNKPIDKDAKEKTLEELSGLHNIYQLSLKNENTPYTSSLISNGRTKVFKYSDETKGDGKFYPQTFADCADTCARHVLNLLTYDSENQMFKLQTPESPELSEVLKAIEEEQNCKVKSLKEKLNIFYQYQNSDKSNDGSTTCRTL